MTGAMSVRFTVLRAARLKLSEFFTIGAAAAAGAGRKLLESHDSRRWHESCMFFSGIDSVSRRNFSTESGKTFVFQIINEIFEENG
jgi:hypothetical protein